jgi:DUF1009 family protein
MGTPIGLIAGSGQLPILEAQGIRAAGHDVACVGLSGLYDQQLPGLCNRFARSGLIRIGHWIRVLRKWNVRQAVMVGGVRKAVMYDPLRILRLIPDWRAAKVWYRVCRDDRRTQSLLTALAAELALNGIELIDTTAYIPQHMADRGVMTRRGLSDQQRGDVEFGWPILAQMNQCDIGQAIAVKHRDIIAVEAVEGTDAMIQRAGQLCRAGGWMLLKGPGPDKDLRFDVSTVGVTTIENLKAAGATGLALEAGRVILADKTQVLAAADAAGITIVGV